MLETKFASAERLEIPDVRKQQDLLAEHARAGYFDFFPHPILVINAQRQIVFCNRALNRALNIENIRDITGMRVGEALGCRYAGLEAGGCGTSEYCRECGAVLGMLECIAREVEVRHECQLLIDTPEGLKAKDLLLVIAPWQAGDQLYYVITLSDIEDEKRRKALERIFFHDILNSAGGAQGLLKLLLDETDGQSKEMIGLAHRSLFSLVEEIKKQRDLTALENGEYHGSQAVVQGNDVLRAIAEEFRLHPLAKDKKIVFEANRELITVKTDPVLLRRVIVNMLVNALEAISVGQDVRLCLKRDAGEAVFKVHNPTVMPESVRLQIFKRSFSTKDKGRGLGTYSIKMLTENYLHGSAGFSSTAESGTTFWVKLKISAPAD